MTIPFCRNLLFVFCILVPSQNLVIAQDDQEATEQKRATVKGRFVQSSKKKHQIDFAEFKIKLVEQVVLPDAAPPANWEQMSPEQRAKYVENFKKSKEGKSLLKRREAILANRNIFDVKIEPDGKWIVFDIPPGRYGLVNGRVDKEVGNRKFAYELFGQFVVSEKVDEVALDPIPMLVTPLLTSGENAPTFKVPAMKNQQRLVELDQFRGSAFLLYFWSTESKPSTSYLTELQSRLNSLTGKYKVVLVSVCLDKEKERGQAWLRKNKIAGIHAAAGGLNHAIVEDYGVRSLPSQWLVGPKSKILMTNFDFRRLGMSGRPIEEIIRDRLDGKSLTANPKK